MRRMWMVAMAMGMLALAGCGGAPKATPGELFAEYAKNPHVRYDDVFGSGGSGADRLANMAAYYTAPQAQARLLGAQECADECQPAPGVLDAAREATGSSTLYRRHILVKHADGSMELLSTYIARGRGTAVLIDEDGDTYRDLAEFRSDGPLDGDDLILTLADVTSVPGQGRIVAVTGSTGAGPWPWIGGAAVVVALGAGLVVLRRRQPKRPEM